MTDGTDIVERLKLRADALRSEGQAMRAYLEDQAAAEITRLRAALVAMTTERDAARAKALEDAARVSDREAAKIVEDEQEKATWGGPDPRGAGASDQAYKMAREFRRLAAAIRAMIEQEDKG